MAVFSAQELSPIEFYHRAHLDVLQRVHAILFEDDTAESESNDARGWADVPGRRAPTRPDGFPAARAVGSLVCASGS